MISDPNEPHESSTIVKIKRDEFLLEIRKKKNIEYINQRRMKLYDGDIKNQNENTLPEEDWHKKSQNQKQQNDINIEEQQETVSNPCYNINKIQVENNLTYAKEKLIEAVQTKYWEEVMQIIKYIRDFTGNNDDQDSIKFILNLGILPLALELLDPRFSDMKKLQSEVCWLLTNLSAAAGQDTYILVEAGILPVLLQCLQTNNEELHENAMWALANIAGDDNLGFRDMILSLDVLNSLVNQLCKTPKKTIYIRTAVWLISNLLRGKPFPPFEKVQQYSVKYQAQFIHHPDEIIQEHTLLSLVHFTECSEDVRIKAILNYGLVQKIVRNINHTNEIIATYALRCAGNLSQVNESAIIKELIKNEVFLVLVTPINHRNKVLRREACFTLSNILAEHIDDYDAFIQGDLIPLLIERMSTDEIEIRIDATYCIGNFASKCQLEQAQFLISKGILDPLLSNLEIENIRLILASLFTLKNLLEHGSQMKKIYNGLNPYASRILEMNASSILEGLQYHKDNKIYSLIAYILDKYFPTETSV